VRWLAFVLMLLALLASLPVAAQQVPNPMSKDGANALLPDALSQLTSQGLHGDLAAHPDWTGARCFQTYKGDGTRPWCVAALPASGFGFAKQVTMPATGDIPLLTVRRDVESTIADPMTGESGAFKVFLDLNNTVPSSRFETAQQITVNSRTLSQTSSRTVTGLHIYAERDVDNKDFIFGMNIQAIDSSQTNNTALINSELDLKAGGPDTGNKRLGVELIAQKDPNYVGIDTSHYAMLRIRTGAGVPTQSPTTIKNGIVIDPGVSGKVETGINIIAGYAGVDAYGLAREGTDGILIGGTVLPVNGNHLRVLGDTYGRVSYGGLNNAAGQTFAQVNYEGVNAAGSRQTYARTNAVVVDPTTGAEVGATQTLVSIAGVLTPAFSVSGGVSHVSVLDTADAASLTNAALIVQGGVAIAKKLYVGGLATTGTAVATLCIDAAGQVFKKTSAGACL